MSQRKNHIGEKHGTLEVIAEAPSRKNKAGHWLTCWKVRCSQCGCEKVMLWGSIRNAKSCGCIKVTDKPKECTCKRCGKSFAGNAFTAYCPECRKKARRESNRLCTQRRTNGTARKLGAEYLCADCGKQYILTNGFQKYCPKCAPKHTTISIKDFKEKYSQK